MAAPRADVVQKKYQNPHAENPLLIPVLVLSNTPDEVLNENVRVNSAKPLKWISLGAPTEIPAVIVGGGPSIADFVEDIWGWQQAGATIFALNGASAWLRGNGIIPDYQVIADAKPVTATLVDPKAKAHLFASQVDPTTMDSVPNPRVWHYQYDEIEDFFPPEKVRRGGYVLVGGGITVGLGGMCLAYAMGYRKLHLYGYDSSNREGNTHAYYQGINEFIPTAAVEWAGRTFNASVAMKAQAEKFVTVAAALRKEGCKIEVYGDGLLPCMYRTPIRELTERDKYRIIWGMDGYRIVSPGQLVAQIAIPFFEKPGPVIDFGCGTGRGGLALSAEGFDVILTDFADNCRDQEALCLPFVEWDITQPNPLRAPFGFCTDVMEHIPTEQIEVAIRNIMTSVKRCFFQICNAEDGHGSVIEATLHNSVFPHEWWREKFESLGYRIVAELGAPRSILVVERLED